MTIQFEKIAQTTEHLGHPLFEFEKLKKWCPKYFSMINRLLQRVLKCGVRFLLLAQQELRFYL